MFDAQKIPQEMKNADRWIIWEIKLNPEKDKHDKKVPYRLTKPYGEINAEDPNNWLSFHDAYHLWTNYGHHDRFPGLGFVLGNGWACLDIDNLTAAQVQQVRAKHTTPAILKSTYCEVSQSGKGLHYFFHANEQSKLPKRHDNKEMYSNKRFIAMTGDCVTVSTIKHLTDPEYLKLHHEMIGERSQVVKTRVNIKAPNQLSAEDNKRFRDAANALYLTIKQNSLSAYDQDNLRALIHGYADHDDRSQRDERVCCTLAYWQASPQLIDWMIRHSALYRPKWNEYRGKQTYGEMTISGAIAAKQPEPTYKFNFQ
ncbi:hypothetical protein [Limosilactobacillus sp.]|uniref:phage NrS-1 polymerase family protein n=1 Tax=Limosilactobacillus sp. TaxID=2773925 RepID=UPI00345E6DDA